METIINDPVNSDGKVSRDIKNKNKENIAATNNDDSIYSQDLKNYTTLQLNEEVEMSNKPFPLHIVNEKKDIPICAQEFSDLTNPLYIKKICLEKVKEWNGLTVNDICVNQILCGLTNQLFCVCLNDNLMNAHSSIRKRVLFRIYGKDVLELYCPAFELEVYKTMSKYKIAPMLINTFTGGRIEEWLYGDPLGVADLENTSILQGIAHLLGKYHTLSRKYTLPAHWEKVPCVYKRMEKWKNQVLTYKDLDKLSYDIYRYVTESDKYIKFLREYTKLNNIGNEIVFSHNDLQENNIISTNKCLRLIDFEYADYNYLSIDIANLFNETTIDYDVNTYPFFAVNRDKYISYENRKLFVSTYLNAYLNDSALSSDENIINPLLEVVEVQALGVHLIWGFWSVIRGYQMKSYNEFDFFLYAKERFNMYDQQKKYLVENNIIKDY